MNISQILKTNDIILYNLRQYDNIISSQKNEIMNVIMNFGYIRCKKYWEKIYISFK